jgi:MarR family transcriptional regulator, transcriptional regulator for hemolysin
MQGDGNLHYGIWRPSLPSSDEHHFGWITADVSRLMRTVFDRRMRNLGLTRAQWLALTRLHRRPGASQQELAGMMEIEKAPAGRIVDRLQDKGWIERRSDAADRRVNRIYLTERGERIHAAMSPIAAATVDDALDDLSQQERDRLIGLMLRVKASLTRLAEADIISEDIDVEGDDITEARVL